MQLAVYVSSNYQLMYWRFEELLIIGLSLFPLLVRYLASFLLDVALLMVTRVIQCGLHF